MRVLSQTPLASGQPSQADILAHLRLSSDGWSEADRLLQAAQKEIEHHAGLAFFNTTVVALSQPNPGIELRLPIGPLADTPDVIAYAVAEDGSEAEITPANIITGQHPELILSTAPDYRVRVTYTAGYGATAADVPPDLWHAVLDQTLRLFDMRGDVDSAPGLCPAAARITARYTRVAIHA